MSSEKALVSNTYEFWAYTGEMKTSFWSTVSSYHRFKVTCCKEQGTPFLCNFHAENKRRNCVSRPVKGRKLSILLFTIFDYSKFAVIGTPKRKRL